MKTDSEIEAQEEKGEIAFWRKLEFWAGLGLGVALAGAVACWWFNHAAHAAIQ